MASVVDGEVPHLSELSDAELREFLVDMDRAANVAHGHAAEAMAEMARRATAADHAEELACGRPLMPHEQRWEFVADEIAVVLAITKVDAARRYGLALAASELPAVAESWRSGDIDARKVQVICDRVIPLSDPARTALAGEAAGYAAKHTASELRRWLDRRVLAADPATAEQRRKSAQSDRCVTFTPLPDGVAELAAKLPALQARQLYDTVNTLAQSAAPNDHRTIDQRRADALVDIVLGRAEPPQVSVQVVVPLDTLMGETAEPGHVAGVGPIGSAEALELTGVPGLDRCSTCDSDIDETRRAAHESVFRRLLTEPSTGHLVDISEQSYRPSAGLDRAVRARDGVCRFPGCSRSASTKRSGTDLDHTIPWPRGQTTASNLAVLCRHHHRVKHSPGWDVELRPDGVMLWRTPTGATYRSEPWSHAEPL
jgi:hypothetical protein